MLWNESDYPEFRDHLLSKRQRELLATTYAQGSIEVDVQEHVAFSGSNRWSDETLTAMFLHGLFEYAEAGDRPAKAKCNEDGIKLSEWLVKHSISFRNAVSRIS